MKIQELCITDEKYPNSLKEIYNPPSKLFVLGNIEILDNIGVSIIGSRRCSKYGMEMSQKFAYMLAKHNINIISGLARGIDTNAHIGCLKAKGKTIAVLGSGLDIIYPSENKKLAENIVKQGGAIISEFPLGMKPLPMNFPKRNRIISGLSKAVVVVEATKKSGTSITVDFALEQGRDVYAMPGNVNQVTSDGTNELIKQGAKPLTSIQDILQDLCIW